MKKSLVMTIIGTDRPGLVDELAAVVAAHEGNWLDGRMAHLSGQFAGLLRVAVPDTRAEELNRALSGLQGLQVVVAESGGTDDAARHTVELDVVGHDRPGIVSEISKAIAGRGMNVEELSTGCESAPMSGEILFRARARISAPAETGIDELRDDLERIAADLMVDIEFNSA